MDTCPERPVLIMMMKVKDVLKLMLKVMKVMMLMMMTVKVFEEVLLFSLSSTQTTNPRTRPAARVWASGAKGTTGARLVQPTCGRDLPVTLPTGRSSGWGERGGEEERGRR